MFIFGQILIGLFFIATGIINIKGWTGNVELLSKTILPLPKLCLIIAILLQFIGGISLILNWHTTIGALACILFTILASAFFMRFWQAPETQNPPDSILVLH